MSDDTSLEIMTIGTNSEVPVIQNTENTNVEKPRISEEQFNELKKIKEKGEDDYEKNIVYIGSGTLILSLTFIEKIVPLQGSLVVWFLIISWGLLALTLLINLVSHQLSSKFHDDCMALYNEDYHKANLKVSRCNNIIRNLNWVTSATLIFGIISLVLFCSFNAIKMSKEKQHVPAPVILPEKQIGRTITPPQSPPTKNVGDGNSNTSK